MQLKLESFVDTIVEWIPYNEFNNIKEIIKSDSFTLYSAMWMNGPLKYEEKKRQYERRLDKKVALKCLNNSQNITNEYLNKV
jgi:hypothetical protein